VVLDSLQVALNLNMVPKIRGARSEIVVATIMRYSKALIFEKILTNCATIERFCLIVTYTQYNFSLFEVPCALICFGLIQYQ